MLLPWHDEIRVYVHPQHIVMVLLSGWFKKHVTYKQVLDCPDLLGTLVWQSVIVTLDKALLSNDWQTAYAAKSQKNIRATVILSNHFVHYALVPWQAEQAKLRPDSDKHHAYLQHCFTRNFGAAAKQWQCRMSDCGMYKPALASAIDSALLQDIEAAFTAANIRIANIHPQLMVAVNQAKSQITQYLNKKAQTYWLVIVENGQSCLLLVEDGAWRLVKSMRFDVAAQVNEQIEPVLQRENALRGGLDCPIFFYQTHHFRTDFHNASFKNASSQNASSQNASKDLPMLAGRPVIALALNTLHASTQMRVEDAFTYQTVLYA